MQQPPYPSTAMAPMSDHHHLHQNITRNEYTSFHDRPASLKINNKVNEYYDFAKYSKKKLRDIMADEKQKMITQMRERRLDSLHSQGAIESSQT